MAVGRLPRRTGRLHDGSQGCVPGSRGIRCLSGTIRRLRTSPSPSPSHPSLSRSTFIGRGSGTFPVRSRLHPTLGCERAVVVPHLSRRPGLAPSLAAPAGIAHCELLEAQRNSGLSGGLFLSVGTRKRQGSEVPLKVIATVDVEENGLFCGDYPQRPPGVGNFEELGQLRFIQRESAFPLTVLLSYPVKQDPRCREIQQPCQRDFGAEIGCHFHILNTTPFFGSSSKRADQFGRYPAWRFPCSAPRGIRSCRIFAISSQSESNRHCSRCFP